jgi:sugar phosphate isomerase/epimerase
VPGVRRELSDGEFDALGMGQLIAPDSRTYARRTTRASRREVEALVESGCPVVTYYPGGRLVWHDEDDAWPAWADARRSLTTRAPDPRRSGESVTAGRWESVDGSTLVVLLWHH